MASLLVFASDHAKNPDPEVDSSSVPKRGHVIDVQDNDDFDWGREIHAADGLGWWRVVVIPGVAAKDCLYLCDGDSRSPLSQRYDSHPRYRVNSVDLDTIEGMAPRDKRHVIRLPKGTDVHKLAKQNEPVPIASVIGGNPRVIG